VRFDFLYNVALNISHFEKNLARYYHNCIAVIMYNTHHVQHTSCTAHIMYSAHYVQRTSCTAHIMYNTHYVQRALCTAHIMYSAHYVQHTLCTAHITHYFCRILIKFELCRKFFEKILKYRSSQKCVQWEPSCPCGQEHRLVIVTLHHLLKEAITIA
jgi:hypothetical protein